VFPALISRVFIALVMTGSLYLYIYAAVFRGSALFSTQAFMTTYTQTTLSQ
jgi:hypothetical protein